MAAIYFPHTTAWATVQNLTGAIYGLAYMPHFALPVIHALSIIPGLIGSLFPAGFSFLMLPITMGLDPDLGVLFLYVWCAAVRSPKKPKFLFGWTNNPSATRRKPIPFWFVLLVAIGVTVLGQTVLHEKLTIYDSTFVGNAYYNGEKLNSNPSTLAMSQNGSGRYLQVRTTFNIPREKLTGPLSNIAAVTGIYCTYSTFSSDKSNFFLQRNLEQKTLFLSMSNPGSDNGHCDRIVLSMSVEGKMKAILSNGLELQMERVNSNDGFYTYAYGEKFWQALKDREIQEIGN